MATLQSSNLPALGHGADGVRLGTINYCAMVPSARVPDAPVEVVHRKECQRYKVASSGGTICGNLTVAAWQATGGFHVLVAEVGAAGRTVAPSRWSFIPIVTSN